MRTVEARPTYSGFVRLGYIRLILAINVTHKMVIMISKKNKKPKLQRRLAKVFFVFFLCFAQSPKYYTTVGSKSYGYKS